MNKPKVSIIILNWNGLKDTVECLDSLKKITYPNYEVIVVDNGSKRSDADVLEEKYKYYIRVIRNKENIGFAKGNNVGTRKVLEDKEVQYVLLLNNDTVVSPDFLDGLISVSEGDPEVGIIGPKILNPDHSLQISCWEYHSYLNVFVQSFLRNSFFYKYHNINNLKKEKEVKVVSGACILLKREVLERVGLLDENIFLYTEETDICYRTKRAGYKIIYCPTSKIIHHGGQATRNISEIAIMNSYRSKIYFFHKHYRKSKAFILEGFLIMNLYERILFLSLMNIFWRDKKWSKHLSCLKEVLKWYKKEKICKQ